MTSWGSARARGVFAVAMIVLVSRADATVTQVDGTIVPVTIRMQQALDTYELPAGSINAVKDASEVPQIFKPRLSAAVAFLDIREGAGFENSFGWYNVGDDVSTPAGRTANLHPVMGCGVQMVATAGDATHHTGNPAAYVLNAEEGSTITVDFAAEATALRYKGGFIGFYLITPEGHASSTNCGDFKNGGDGKSLFGFIYFTQKDLNNDGDFVHHLVYKSKTADRFFFGFEDLFRGGDNDYEDMAMRIDGLTPPCVPSAEVCDTIDNDCDGLIDALDPDLTGTGEVCQCDDLLMTCDNGPRAGQCQVGVTACTAGAITCHGTGTSSAEICDGLDNNCNNLVDDNPSGTGATCDGQDSDLCKEGRIVCLDGALTCNDSTGPNVELCNHLDDDCDGQIDEGDPGGGGACGSSLGVCTLGTLHCVGGGLVCQGGNTGGPELCNGLDDNCNGVADDNPTDVGLSCGASAAGECRLGQTICSGGIKTCAGEVGPTPERCNSLDDDCDGTIDDNPVDAGQPCGSSIGACRPGVFVCAMGGLVCTGGIGPTVETCNGLDDDCDGVIDDGVPGDGDACGAGDGPCSAGTMRCISGAMQCVGGTSGGTEVCNGIDDDCDGMIDNGDLCAGGVCDHGQCAAPCQPDEFPCPSGKRCETGYCVDDPCYGVSCPNDADGNIQTCRAGGCQPLCPTISCPGALVCRGSDGACVRDTCDYLPKCSATELCIDAVCQPNPCTGVACASGEFCRAGTCVASCQGVSCGAGKACQDGACVATGCATSCADGVCNPDTHQCQANLCTGVVCSSSKACEPLTGTCAADACFGVSCPSGQACALGQCGTASHGGLVTTGGGGGCAASGGGGSLLVGLAAIALLLGRRRRRSLRTCALAATLALGGCRVNDYCLECEVGNGSGSGDGGVGSGSGSGEDSGTRPAACDPNQIHPEACNGVDDNCDGQIDEGFDLQNDELNCGACGIQCNKPGAQTKCVSGSCTITGCFPGFLDRDHDTTGAYPTSDGCEYMCFTSNAGIEACDGLDNDCNGVVDEGFDKTSDPQNCGACGRTCEFFAATGHCANSACAFDPATDCQPGFFDIDHDPANGCEYQCAPTNGGVEACDLRDNDCDGQVDEDFAFASDPANCGRCGLVCQFPNATPSCTLGTCRFEPQTDCRAGFVDADGKQLDGCEYQCSKTNGGVEICDGVDNDCNGVADDNLVDTGLACASTTPPRGACTANGTLTCAAGHLSCSGATESARELCNNVDDDCDGAIDDGVTQVCYDGDPGTSGIGVCHPGFATCAAGMFGACASEVTPQAELCNGLDDDCNGAVDDAAGGGAITATCYTGPAVTENVGTCTSGTKTCAFGAFGACTGEVVPQLHEVCGDGLDTDCDGVTDAAEGCQVLDAELRLDAPGGPLGEATPGTLHSYDVVLARGGVPLGSNIYAAWSQLVGSNTEVYVRASADGGATWGTILNVTAGIAGNKVKPALAVAPGAIDRIVVVYQTVTAGVRDIKVQISSDGGASFGAASAALDAAGDSFHHSVAISGSTCVVAWEKLDTTTLNRDVMSRTSSTGCATFNAETKINVGSPATRFAGRPQVGITSAGGIVWAWREQRANSTRDIFAAAAANPTTPPTADVRIDGDTTGKRESDFPVLRVNEASAYLVWQDVSTIAQGSDAMFARSIDGGASWNAERIIDDPVTEVSSSFAPTIAIDPRGAGTADDLVAIAWEDRRQGTQIFASISSDGGATFQAPLRASSDAGVPVAGQVSVPQIAAAGGGVLAVVYQNQPANGRPQAYVATSIDTGATWTFSEFRADTGAGAALVPQVVASRAAGKPAAVVAWTDFRANQIDGDIYVALSH